MFSFLPEHTDLAENHSYSWQIGENARDRSNGDTMQWFSHCDCAHGGPFLGRLPQKYSLKIWCLSSASYLFLVYLCCAFLLNPGFDQRLSADSLIDKVQGQMSSLTNLVCINVSFHSANTVSSKIRNLLDFFFLYIVHWQSFCTEVNVAMSKSLNHILYKRQ